MNKLIAIACFAAFLGAPARAQTMSPDSTFVSIIDPVTGQKAVRPATPAERALVRKTLQGVQPSLAGLEASLAPLKNLGPSLAPLKGLGARLEGLKNLGPKLERLQRMVETETPVSTRRTSEGLVRVYRDGTTVIDSADGRTFNMKD